MYYSNFLLDHFSHYIYRVFKMFVIIFVLYNSTYFIYENTSRHLFIDKNIFQELDDKKASAAHHFKTK